MTSYDEMLVATEAAMSDPKAGDRFHEMYSFWVYVLRVMDGTVMFMEASGHPSDLTPAGLTHATIAEFSGRYAYRSIPGHSVLLCDRGNDMSRWLTHFGIVGAVAEDRYANGRAAIRALKEKP